MRCASPPDRGEESRSSVGYSTPTLSPRAAEKYAHVQLIFLALQMIKKSPHPQKLSFPGQHESSVFFLQVRPRHIERNARLLGVTLQIGAQRTILRLGPRFNRAIGQGFDLVRNDEIEVEVDCVPEPLAPRTRPIRVVERKKPRLRFLIPQIANLALKPLRKA